MTSGFIGMPLWTIPPEPLQPMTSGFIGMPLRTIPPEPLQSMTSGFYTGFVIFSENTPFSFLFSFSVGKFSGRKFSGSPSSTASIVVLLVQPAPEEEDLTNEEGE